ncbi:MAG: signal peptidase I [Ruminococcus flavefaciens]|nr:signal peptidase I [Ruminococcus flavefaciens]
MLKEVNESLFEKKDGSKLNIILNVIIGIIVVALAAEIIFASTYSGIYVVGSSMNNTLTGAVETRVLTDDGKYYWIADTGGDYVYANRYAKPDYGDIVVVLRSDGTTIIKRVIAKGGDTVKLTRGVLHIKYAGQEDYELIEEDYIDEENNTPVLNTFPAGGGGHLVEENCLFLLGDNRNVSVDSRESGDFPLDSVLGVVAEWSVNGKGFFTALHKYFYFELPAAFGVDKRMKRSAD